MASSSERRGAALFGPPAFRDRTEAGVLLGAALRAVLREFKSHDAERVRVSADPFPIDPGLLGRQPPRVFGIPRGGVAVAAGVARALNVPLDVLVVRKIGHPEAPELGLGAIASGGGSAAEPFFDEGLLAQVGLTRKDLAEVVTRERAELARRVAVYGSLRSPPTAAGDAGAVGDAEAAGEAGMAASGGTPGSSGTALAGGAADLAGQLVIVVDDGLATGVTARAALRAARARGAARTVLAVPVAAPAAAEAMKTETDEVVTLVTPRRFRSVGEWYADFGQLTDADVLILLDPRDGASGAAAP